MKELRNSADFLDELKRVGADGMVNYFLLEGVPFFFKDDWEGYCDFKREIADAFGVHPKTVMLVGSGRLGFSTTRDKLWRAFDGGKKRSDLDVVVADPDLFDRAWRELCDHEMSQDALKADLKALARRRNTLYEGRLDPEAFPEQMLLRTEWLEFFEKCSKRAWAGSSARKISGRIFRDWRFVQRYYRQSFQEIIDSAVK